MVHQSMVESTKATLVCALLLLLAVGGMSASKTVHSRTPHLALDGVGVTPSDWPFHHGVKSQLLNTTRGNDVIVLIVEIGPVLSIIDSSGLNFTQRVSYQGILQYYARATSPLRSDNITVVCDCMPFAGMQVLAVRGANTRAIFDASPSIPSLVSCPFSRGDGAYVCASPGYGECLANGLGDCAVSIQTSTIDFVIATTAKNDAGRLRSIQQSTTTGIYYDNLTKLQIVHLL